MTQAEQHANFRRTKIVTTIGPATREVETMAELIKAGADVFRLNFSHGSEEDHAENIRRAREASKIAGREIGLLGDLPGPKIRIGKLEGNMLKLAQGSEVTLVCDGSTVDGAVEIPMDWTGIAAAVKPGSDVYLADGRIRLSVTGVEGGRVTCRVAAGGPIASHQGLNLPRTDVPLPAAGAEDLAWVDFAVRNKVDLLAVSFVRNAADLAPVEERIRNAGSTIPLIAKIEKPEAAENADEILEAATAGIMVARGDLGIEIPIVEVPVVQKSLLAKAGLHSKPAITATQMMASMVTSPRPTRAEVTDVANAIFDGTDAIMLSEETAVGEYPVETVKVMDGIARATEAQLPYEHWVHERVGSDEGMDVANSVARAAVGATRSLGLKALIVPTNSGRTARLVSAHRPEVPVLAVTSHIETARRMNMVFGVRTALAQEWTSLRALIDDCARLAKETGTAQSGDLIGITAGLPEQELGTNLFEVHRVP